MRYRGFGYGLCRVLLGAWVVAILPPLIDQFAQPAFAIDQIVEIRNGRASLQRGNRRRPAPVGTQILTGDLVFPTRGATVKVRCQDRSFGARTRVFGLADVCPESSHPRFPQSGRGEDDFLAFLEGNFEYAAQVADGNPTLRWNPVENAATYRLQMWDCGQGDFNCTSVIWEATVEDTQIPYQGAALEPGRNYRLAVSAIDDGDRTSSYLTLRRLDQDQLEALQTAAAQLEGAELSTEVNALALTRIYLEVAEPNTLPPNGAGLVLAAIPALEGVTAESATPYLHRLLGDLYLQVGLLEAAQTEYEMTLSFTTWSDDIASRAAAQVGLANIAAAQGERSQAETWLQRSRVNYALLGEDNRKDQVEQWIEKLRL